MAGATGLILSFLAGIMVGRGVDTAAGEVQASRPAQEERIVEETPAPATPAAEDLSYAQRLEGERVDDALERRTASAPPATVADASRPAAAPVQAPSKPVTKAPAPRARDPGPPARRRRSSHGRAASGRHGRRRAGDRRRVLHDPGRRVQGRGERRIRRRPPQAEGLRGLRRRAGRPRTACSTCASAPTAPARTPSACRPACATRRSSSRSSSPSRGLRGQSEDASSPSDPARDLRSRGGPSPVIRFHVRSGWRSRAGPARAVLPEVRPRGRGLGGARAAADRARAARAAAGTGSGSGYLTGAVASLGLVYWTALVVTQFGGLPLRLGAGVMVLLCLALALFPSLFGWLAAGWVRALGPRALLLAPSPGWPPRSCARTRCSTSPGACSATASTRTCPCCRWRVMPPCTACRSWWRACRPCSPTWRSRPSRGRAAAPASSRRRCSPRSGRTAIGCCARRCPRPGRAARRPGAGLHPAGGQVGAGTRLAEHPAPPRR